MTQVKFEDMIGITFNKVYVDQNEEMIIFENEETKFALFHSQDCCEAVDLEEIVGDLPDLIGTPILEAREDTNSSNPPKESKYEPDSYTWSFYNFRTIKGSVTIRFYGESNGYYGETADLHKWSDRYNKNGYWSNWIS